jgi:hypothetical protein
MDPRLRGDEEMKSEFDENTLFKTLKKDLR